MHLDTIFTVIDKDACIGFRPLVFESNIDVTIKQYAADTEEVKTYASIGHLIRDIYPEMRCIPCGGGVSPYEEREQWTDGSNLVTLKAGVFYGYERNYHTSEHLKKYGYFVEHASMITDAIEEGTMDPSTIEKMLITIPSGELSRARGGSHCMTLPIHRTAENT